VLSNGIFTQANYCHYSLLNSKFNITKILNNFMNFFNFPQCQSVIFIILSSLSIFSYYCWIETSFNLSPTTYMIHLMYFKSQYCGNESDWTHLNVMNFNEVQAVRPDTTSAIERTFIISILYLILYSCLILSSAMIIRMYYFSHHELNHHQIYFYSEAESSCKETFTIMYFDYVSICSHDGSHLHTRQLCSSLL